MSQEIKYSIVVPVYNSEPTLEKLFNSLQNVFESLNETFEVIFVEDGGKDNSWKVINKLHKENPRLVTAVRLNKNYGQHNANFLRIGSFKW